MMNLHKKSNWFVKNNHICVFDSSSYIQLKIGLIRMIFNVCQNVAVFASLIVLELVFCLFR